MTPAEVEQLFARLEYEQDVRRYPDERRRGQFRSGWEDATEREEIYVSSTLRRLTWHNLGYRLGKHFGHQPLAQINQAFEILANLYEPSSLGSGQTLLTIPSPRQYVAAFREVVNLTDSHIQMLRLHYHAPERTITATQMARAVGFNHYSVANLQYGRLGRLVGDQLEYNPMKERLGTLVTFKKRQGEWHWLMRPEVAQALESLGWVEGINLLLPEEIPATTVLIEGAVRRVSVSAYERNPEARRRCIERHGTSCYICGFNFGAAYGSFAEGFIHVHHLKPLSKIGTEYEVDPVTDLRPVCPNCHAVIHLGGQTRTIEEVKELLVQTSPLDPAL